MPELHPVTNYIKQARQQGMSNDQIVKALTDAGWHVNEILDVVLEHTVPAVPVPGKTGAAPGPIISVQGISKSYDKVKALDNVSLVVQP